MFRSNTESQHSTSFCPGQHKIYLHHHFKSHMEPFFHIFCCSPLSEHKCHRQKIARLGYQCFLHYVQYIQIRKPSLNFHGPQKAISVDNIQTTKPDNKLILTLFFSPENTTRQALIIPEADLTANISSANTDNQALFPRDL